MTNKIKATLITWLMCLALLATISAAYLINIQGRTLFKLPNQATVLVEVKSGSNVVQLLKQMNQRDYLTDTGVLQKLWLKTNPHISQIKAGWYQLSHDESLVSWLSEVTKGEVYAGVVEVDYLIQGKQFGKTAQFSVNLKAK